MQLLEESFLARSMELSIICLGGPFSIMSMVDMIRKLSLRQLLLLLMAAIMLVLGALLVALLEDSKCLMSNYLAPLERRIRTSTKTGKSGMYMSLVR